MALLLAVVASFANALSAILQRTAVQHAPERTRLRLSLVVFAVRRWVWLVGLALLALGFVLQAVALRFGRLSEVQPVVTTELLFVVLVLGTWYRYRVGGREWVGALAAAGGLATLLVVANPSGDTRVPGLGAWGWTLLAVGGAVVVAVLLAFVGPRWFRAGMFGLAAALLFAVAAALTKVFSTLVTTGWGHVFDHWEPYGLAASGVAGLFLAQNAFHAGPITASQSTLTIVDPLASVALGVWLFGEHLATAGWRAPVELLALVVLCTGVVVLSRSPLVAGAMDESGAHDLLVRQPSRRRRSVGAAGGSPGAAPGHQVGPGPDAE
ncbi:MAG: DMT family transporter [Actinomycetota bacterium]|nr:DMT family transporter [Actinomycetota bacterium]